MVVPYTIILVFASNFYVFFFIRISTRIIYKSRPLYRQMRSTLLVMEYTVASEFAVECFFIYLYTWK